MGARRVTAVIGLLFALMIGAASPASAMTTPTPPVSPTSVPPTHTATHTRIPASLMPRPTADILATASVIAAQPIVGPTQTPTAVGSGEATTLPPDELTRVRPESDPSARCVPRQTPIIAATRPRPSAAVRDDGGAAALRCCWSRCSIAAEWRSSRLAGHARTK